MVNDLWAYGTHGFVAGEPKVYKSWFVLDIACSVATGTPAFGRFEVPTAYPVMYFEREFNPKFLQLRLDQILKPKRQPGKIYTSPPGTLNIELPPRIPLYIRTREELDLGEPEDLEFLATEVERLGIKLLILDPLLMMLGSVDENSGAAMRSVLQNLLRLKDRTGVSIMIVHHYAKPSATNPRTPGQRILGSTAIHGWYESALHLSKPSPEAMVTHVYRDFRNHAFDSGFDIEYFVNDEAYNVTVTGNESKAKRKVHENAGTLEDMMDYVFEHPEGVMLSELAVVLKRSPKTILAWTKLTDRIDAKQEKGGLKGGKPQWIIFAV
jgi:hypothetical protein